MNEDRKAFLADIHEGMDPGEMQYFANRMFKHNRVVPQKVKEFVPQIMLQEVYENGTLVEVMRTNDIIATGSYTVVLESDGSCGELTYRVYIPGTAGATTWLPANVFRKVEKPS